LTKQANKTKTNKQTTTKSRKEKEKKGKKRKKGGKKPTTNPTQLHFTASRKCLGMGNEMHHD